MPATFPEMWLSRVVAILTSLTAINWLDGISEIDTEVLEVGSGSASESNIIHIPIETFEVDVLINNTAYPIALQAYDDTSMTVQLDKYQTKVTTLSDDQTMGSSYPKIDSATRAHTRSILTGKFKKAIHSLAPSSDSADTPVLETTGPVIGGRKTLIYDDLVSLKQAFDDMDTPEVGRRLVLSSDHYNDMLRDKERFANLLINHNTGKVAPLIAGFEIYTYLGMPSYDASKSKLAYGQVPGATDKKASVAFYVENVAKKTGLTKQYFADSKQDPENQTNRLAYRHYFIAVPVRQKYMAAIVSANATNEPYIASATPEPSAVGDVVTIEGFNFTGTTAVNFGSTAGTSVTVVNSNKLTVVVPTLADDTYDITVTTPVGTSNIVPFAVAT